MADSFVSRFGCYTIIWDTTAAGPLFVDDAAGWRNGRSDRIEVAA